MFGSQIWPHIYVGRYVNFDQASILHPLHNLSLCLPLLILPQLPIVSVMDSGPPYAADLPTSNTSLGTHSTESSHLPPTQPTSPHSSPSTLSFGPSLPPTNPFSSSSPYHSTYWGLREAVGFMLLSIRN